MPLDPPDPDTPDDIFDLSDIPNLKERQGEGRGPRSWQGKPRTAEDLGVSIEAAQKGSWSKVLPKEQYYNGLTYPIPGDKGDLYRLALCNVKYVTNSPAKQYVRRCFDAYSLWFKNRGAIDLGARQIEAKRVVTKIRKTSKKADEEFEQFKEGLAKKAQYARATLTDLYDLAGSGFKKIMEAFVNDKEIDGEKVSVKDFTGAAGKVFGQVARLGTPATDDAKEEAQSVVFEEALKEIREKVEMGQVVATAPEKKDTTH